LAATTGAPLGFRADVGCGLWTLMAHKGVRRYSVVDGIVHNSNKVAILGHLVDQDHHLTRSSVRRNP
jgi:hypothetical protein